MPFVLMIKQEVEKVDGYQYNFHKRTVFANEESVSVVYNCSLSLGVEDRHKIIKSEDNKRHRLISISPSVLL